MGYKYDFDLREFVGDLLCYPKAGKCIVRIVNIEEYDIRPMLPQKFQTILQTFFSAHYLIALELKPSDVAFPNRIVIVKYENFQFLRFPWHCPTICLGDFGLSQ